MINLKLLPVISYITSQVGYENGHAYQLEDVKMIWHSTLPSNLKGNLWWLEGRITNWILRVKVYRNSKYSFKNLQVGMSLAVIYHEAHSYASYPVILDYNQ